MRFYYGIILCETKQNDETIETIDYLIDVISHYKITNLTFLCIRGVPTTSMLVDKDTLKYELKDY